MFLLITWDNDLCAVDEVNPAGLVQDSPEMVSLTMPGRQPKSYLRDTLSHEEEKMLLQGDAFE